MVDASTDRVCRRIVEQGRAPHLTQRQIQRLADEWGPLAGALATLLRENGHRVPDAWRRAEQRWGRGR